MSNKSINVVADLVQLSSGANGFIMDASKGIILREKVKPTRAYAEQINRSSVGSGKMYVIDEEATSKNEAERAAQKAERDSVEDAVQVGEEIIEAIVTAKSKKRAAKKVKKTED